MTGDGSFRKAIEAALATDTPRTAAEVQARVPLLERRSRRSIASYLRRLADRGIITRVSSGRYCAQRSAPQKPEKRVYHNGVTQAVRDALTDKPQNSHAIWEKVRATVPDTTPFQVGQIVAHAVERGDARRVSRGVYVRASAAAPPPTPPRPATPPPKSKEYDAWAGANPVAGSEEWHLVHAASETICREVIWRLATGRLPEACRGALANAVVGLRERVALTAGEQP